jgi:hypothetical protein
VRAELLGVFERGADVRRGPAGGDADDDVTGLDARRAEILSRPVRSIFGAFLRAGQRRRAAGMTLPFSFPIARLWRSFRSSKSTTFPSTPTVPVCPLTSADGSGHRRLSFELHARRGT